MIAYIVWGTNGQDYSDRDEWDVAVYFDKACAEQHASLANDWVKTIDPDSEAGPACPYDPVHTSQHGNWALRQFSYEATTVGLFRHVDEFMEQVDLWGQR